MMKILLFIHLLACVPLAALSIKPKPVKKPNIILIMADDLGYETIGCNGNNDKLTPNLDRLAAEGMRFENCYSMPLCTPSRVQLMTGKYNNRNYIGFGLLDPKETTFGHVMQRLGYKTCVVGKWQLYGYQRQWELAGGRKGSRPENSGFNNFCVWQVDKVGSRYKDPVIYTEQRTSVTLKGKYGEDVFLDYIEKFMEQNRDEPFMIYYPMCLTHDPFVPTPFSPDYLGYDPQNKINDPRYFKDMLKYMDFIVGRISDKVKELGLNEETIIMFTGDNGTSPKVASNFKGKVVWGNKGHTSQRGTHVPLIVKWGEIIKPGSVNSSLIDFTDFFPTLIEAANGEVKSPGLDGISFFPQLKGDFSKQRDWIFCYYDPRWGKYGRQVFAHDKELKLYDDGKIYNIKNDPDELNILTKSMLNSNELEVINKLERVIYNKLM